ncbi:hypothetical protein D3C87_278830 [compost metagenome]
MDFQVTISKIELRQMIQDKLRDKKLALAGATDDLKITDNGIVVQCKEYSPPSSASYYDR